LSVSEADKETLRTKADLPAGSTLTFESRRVCPPPGESTDINLDGGGILAVSSSSAGTLCTLTQVRTENSKDVQVIPIARSYEANPWESAAGDTAIEIFRRSGGQPVCTENSCTINLPALPDPATYRYALTTYSYDLSRKDEVARFLDRSTFGTTPTDLALHDTAAWGDTYRANHVKDQMDTTITPMTSHREYFRKRTNPKVRRVF
jgi:hypothetical protein